MFLAIDVGNTHTTLGLFDDHTMQACWRVQTNPKNTADELTCALLNLLKLKGLDTSSIDSIGISCVVPVLLRAWKVAGMRLEKPVISISDCDPCPIEILAPNPKSAGADRIANLVAAKARFGAPVMVVDFGTATNIDVANQDGAFVGGTISPGVMLSADALFARAALLAGTSIEMPPHVIGDTTTTCIQSGIVIGAACMVEGLVARIRQELDAPTCPVVATGGLARTISEATSVFDAVVPNLTLEGIYRICCE